MAQWASSEWTFSRARAAWAPDVYWQQVEMYHCQHLELEGGFLTDDVLPNDQLQKVNGRLQEKNHEVALALRTHHRLLLFPTLSTVNYLLLP